MRRNALVAAGAALCVMTLMASADARSRIGRAGTTVACDGRVTVGCSAWNRRRAVEVNQRDAHRRLGVQRGRGADRGEAAPSVLAAFDDSGRWPAVFDATPTGTALVSAGRAVDQHLRDLVSAAAAAAGVPTDIAHAIVRVESNYRPRAVSSARALGMGQIKCETARSVGFAGPCSGLFDPESNLRYAMIYLRQALDRGGQGCAGFSLYERGIAARPVCTSYGRRVAALAAR